MKFVTIFTDCCGQFLRAKNDWLRDRCFVQYGSGPESTIRPKATISTAFKFKRLAASSTPWSAMLAPPELDIKIFKFSEAGRQMSTSIQDQGPRELKDYCHFMMSGRQKELNLCLWCLTSFRMKMVGYVLHSVQHDLDLKLKWGKKSVHEIGTAIEFKS